MNAPTFMQQEIAGIPDAVATFLDRSAAAIERAGRRLRDKDPALIATVARGSSDHAANYLKYAAELSAGIPVASLGPSIASIFGARLKLDRAACVAISQSGKSPDIVKMAETAREGGAFTVALTNTAGSPLAETCDEVIDILAGAEHSVAATKTFVNSVVAGLALLAESTRDDRLRHALAALPDQLETARNCDWSMLCEATDDHESLFILGRGPSLAPSTPRTGASGRSSRRPPAALPTERRRGEPARGSRRQLREGIAKVRPTVSTTASWRTRASASGIATVSPLARVTEAGSPTGDCL